MPAVRGGVKPDLLATVSAEIEARLEQLRPALAEYEQLLSAVAALETEEREERKPAPVRREAPVRKAPTQRRSPLALKASLAPMAPKARKAPTPREAAPPAPVAPKAVAAKEPAAPKRPRARTAAPKRESAPAPARPKRGESEQAIFAALEHGSHTLAELQIVTGMSGSVIRDGLRGLAKAKKITKAKREGKAAYALA